MLNIYTPQITNRIKYTFDLFFKEALGIDYAVTENLEEFQSKPDPKFCYDHQTIENTVCFGAAFLLFEKGIKEQVIQVSVQKGLKVFFQLENTNYALPFDPFAAAFYLVSRYEEYLPHVKDHFGRFPAKESLAYKNGFLQIPVVNHYIKLVEGVLKNKYPDIKFSKKEYQFLPTYDIDSAYAYQNKGVIRNIGGLARSLIEFDLENLINRLMVMAHRRQDPFDNYDWLASIHQKHNLSPIYFFLIGDYDEYDKNISISIGAFQALIKSIADQEKVGIHPSFASNAEPEKLTKEINDLSVVLRRDITRSRQHFLKLNIPQTYQRLIKHDIEEDYTMGYASHPGFRAGICQPFYFYNLENENKTQLKIHPFSIMDATLNYYLRQPASVAMETIFSIIKEVKKVDGIFVSLWHNSSLSEEKEWVGWRKVYLDMVEIASVK